MARAGQGMDFFRFICDVEKENQKENGGSFPGFGSLAGIFAQKIHFEVKGGKHRVEEKLFLEDDAFWWEFFRYNHKIALNLEFSWSFLGGTPSFGFFSEKHHFLGKTPSFGLF